MKNRQQSAFTESSRFSFLLVVLLCTLVDRCLAASIRCSPGDQNRHCVGINACLANQCPHGSVCRTNNGSQRCDCQKGFRLCLPQSNCTTGRPYCKDTDECKIKPKRCGTGGSCVNTIGKFCCVFKSKPGEDRKTNCSDCEIDCHMNKRPAGDANSEVSDQMCMSTCQIQTLYKNMSAVDGQSDQPSKVTRLLENAESTLISLVEASLYQSEERKSTEDFEICVRRQIKPEEPLVLSTLGNTVEVEQAVFADKASDRTIPAIALLVHKNMETILSNSSEEVEDAGKSDQPKMVLNSKVLTVVISGRKKNFQTHPIIISFNHIKINENNSHVSCVYWNHTATGSCWSTEGCELMDSNTTHTVCKVFHLSSFAVLMALKDLPVVFALNVITYIGLSISLVCLFMAIVTFATCYPLKDTRCTIHINLCVSLFAADLVFLAGISQTGNRIVCGLIAGVLHYSFLSVFTWMFLEGVQLYLMVEVVFAPRIPLRRYMFWIGYGVPALIVAVSAAVDCDGYGTPSFCWLKTEKYFACSFFVPVILICFINVITLGKTLMRLKEQMSNISSDQKKLKKYRVFTVTAIGQLVILGCTWILGAFYIQEATIPMMFIFTILNSFQGMFIFITHCLMYKKVRDSYTRCLRKCWKKSARWTPVSTSSTRSATSQGKRSVQETESTTSGTVQ